MAALTDLVRAVTRRARHRDAPQHIRVGAQGEKIAARFLRRNGYKVLYRDFKGRTGGQIDLVCREGDTLVFVEVKTRGPEAYGRPAETIYAGQRNRIGRGALAWLRLLDNPDILFRFDAVEVMMDEHGAAKCELVRNAFELPRNYIY